MSQGQTLGHVLFWRYCKPLRMLYTVCMGRSRRHPAVAGIDPEALAAFQAGIRKRYTDEEILAQLKDSAERLGRSPTMREFAADAQTTVHPQTVIEHFGSWNAAKRQAGLVPRRFATREELLGRLRALGEELGRDADGARHRRAQGRDPLEVAPLAHVRLAGAGAAGGGIRRAGGGGAAGAGGRAGRHAGANARPAAEDGRLGRRPACRRVAADRVAGLPDDRRPACLGRVPVPRPRAAARGGRRRRARTDRSASARRRERSRRAA